MERPRTERVARRERKDLQKSYKRFAIELQDINGLMAFNLIGSKETDLLTFSGESLDLLISFAMQELSNKFSLVNNFDIIYFNRS